jgi:signal transduction histidine kinase/ActR/RegA family two-component response regulator
MTVGRMASVPLRRRLLLLAVAGILPLAVMAGIGLYVQVQQQRRQAQAVGRELARAMATAVDSELGTSIAVLEALATTPTLDRHDLVGFRERATRMLRTQPRWDAVWLADPLGNRLVDTRYPAGAALPPLVEHASFDRVVRTRAAVVGGLARSPHGALLYSVRVPVMRNGELRYVLTALVNPEEIRDVIVRQGAPSDWTISVFDGNGRRVARSRAHEANLGGEAAPTLRELMATGAREGFGMTYTLEGERSYTPYSRLPSSGWAVAPSMPAALVDGPAYRSAVVYGAGVVLSIALGIVVALLVARSINTPIADLRAAAQALGRREAPTPPDTSIQELRDVATALLNAADARAKAEAEREALLRLEQKARATAEAADRAKDQFLAVLSHELRTPLNAVYGWARMLRTGQVADEAVVARALDVIERNAHAQLQLIEDLLDVSRVISGKMRLDVRALDLAPVVAAAVDAVRPAAEAKGLRLQTVLDPRAGPVTGDPDRLQQVVWNLLMNAVKFTPKGGRVQVHLQRVNSHVEIVVTDTGQGIAPEILPFVFDRFRQADSSSTRAFSGLGLGLALVKHLVELHGGTVAAQSAGDGHGATFVVRLPLAIAEIPAASGARVHPTAPLEPAPAGRAHLEGVRVLAVDDEPDALELVTAILSSVGATVKTCRSAAEGLDVLREWRPDVLISDIEMPGEDGYAFIRKVRALAADAGGHTPAVALTAYGRTQDRVRSLATGYNMHVAKPVDPAELTAIVASVAARSSSPTR